MAEKVSPSFSQNETSMDWVGGVLIGSSPPRGASGAISLVKGRVSHVYSIYGGTLRRVKTEPARAARSLPGNHLRPAGPPVTGQREARFSPGRHEMCIVRPAPAK